MPEHEPNSILEKAALYGQCQFEPEQAALLLGVSEEDFFEGDLFPAWEKGRLEALVAVRRSIVTKASDGDRGAQTEFLKLAGKLE